MEKKDNLIILCTGNSCRSQMAEGFFRHYGSELLKVYSAGIEPKGIHPLAIKVMKEAGVDISSQRSNRIDEFLTIPFDYIITVCDHAKENCPHIPSPALKIHQSFPDPDSAIGNEAKRLNFFRKVRDQIDSFAKEFLLDHYNIALGKN